MSGRLPAVSPSELERALERLGFQFVRSRGSHRFYHHPATKRTTTIPFHPGDVPRALLRTILKQAGISDAEFLAVL